MALSYLSVLNLVKCKQWLRESLYLSLAMVINYPGDHSGFSKERPLSWKAPYLRCPDLTEQPGGHSGRVK